METGCQGGQGSPRAVARGGWDGWNINLKIRPIVTYGCETCVLKENIIQKLSVFE